MSVIKSFSVGDGDLCYIRHSSDNFSIIDCNLTGNRDDEIFDELVKQSKDKGVTRYISTHPDQDHFEGIEKIDDRMSVRNFYVVKNQAIKEKESESFKLYKKLRDGDRAYYIHKGCTRKWMNRGDDVRGSSGISVLWPDTKNKYFKEALEQCNSGESYNNVSAVVRYELSDGASFMWLGDLETCPTSAPLRQIWFN